MENENKMFFFLHKIRKFFSSLFIFILFCIYLKNIKQTVLSFLYHQILGEGGKLFLRGRSKKEKEIQKNKKTV